MKNTLFALLGFIILSTPLAATAQQFGDFTYTNDCCAVTITGYTGPGGAVSIPDTIIGLPVTTIGDYAFQGQTSPTGVTIPSSVTSIGTRAFYYCIGLTNVAIPGSVTSISYGAFEQCTSLTSATIPGSVTSIAHNAFYECRSLTSLAIPAGVTSIGSYAFALCTSLTNVTLPASLIGFGDWAFSYCYSLTSVTIPASVVSHLGNLTFAYCGLKAAYFLGNAPFDTGTGFSGTSATVYYLPDTTGWGATFAGRPTRLWNPLMQSSGPGFGVGPAGFGFNITGTADIPFVVEACTSLANASWVPLQSLTLTNGAFYFSDPNWTSCPARYYRIRSP